MNIIVNTIHNSLKVKPQSSEVWSGISNEIGRRCPTDCAWKRQGG